MSGVELLVAKVVMPERGVFSVRVDEDAVKSGIVRAGDRGKFVVTLDYGEDVGQVGAVEPYDVAVHGTRVPGFRLLRPLTAADGKILEENARLASAMAGSFAAVAKEAAGDLRIPFSRLSFARRRLFLRCVTEVAKPDFSAAQEYLLQQFGVETNIWPMGPRDEVSVLGGLGPCGRACCCCSWQFKYPSHLAPDRRESTPALMNGACGRFKCCLAFERG
jgi:cell fate regulator YaaT (PSP1 superfamily)